MTVLQMASTPDERQVYTVVVALPPADHPVNAMGEEPKHVTLAFLGEYDGDLTAIHETVTILADQTEPFSASVSGPAQLGEDKAKVLLVESTVLQQIRNTLLDEPVVVQAIEASDSHPHFVPHMTITYGEQMPTEADGVTEIPIDRLAVWHGEDQTEYPLGAAMTASAESLAPELSPELQWHGILAPEGVFSGDKRQFLPGSLRNRPLPLPLTWQKEQNEGHDGSVTVASIDWMNKVDGMLWGGGRVMQTADADEWVGVVSHFGRYGVSVDADEATGEVDEETGERTFSDARVCSASSLSIPAFAEAYVTLGPAPEGIMPPSPTDMPTEEPVDCEEHPEHPDCADKTDKTDKPPNYGLELVSEESWDGSAGRFTPEQWKSSCVLHVCAGAEKSCHKLPIKEPGGALSRAGVHAAASRFNQVDAPAEAKARAKAALRGAYSTLGEEVPEALKATAEEVEAFGRGPGWVTNPADTKRIHDYWTVPGQPGYAKIAWGVPGDFNRCRAEVGEEIGEESPEKLRFINQICAQWHHDATGFWPGHAPTEGGALKAPEGEPGPALNLVAAAGPKPPGEWFTNPEFKPGDGRLVEQRNGSWACPLTITEEGRVFGHLAAWKSCHTAYEMCHTPPHSASGYAYFHLGEIETTDGPVACGQITLGAGHAGGRLRPRAAIAHYDNVSTATCDIVVGDDEYGIWFSGALRPEVDETVQAALRAAKLSGDWRTVTPGDEPELIAALAVNVPGYPIPRTSYTMVDGHQVSLVAAGMVENEETVDVVDGVIEAAIKRYLTAQGQRKARLGELAARIGVGA